MKIKTFCSCDDKNLTYVVDNGKECAVLDPSISAKVVLKYAEENNLSIAFVVFLHSHLDHIVDLDVYRRKGISICGHESTEIKIDKKLRDGQVISLDSLQFKVLHTPGHCFDCICLLLNGKRLFTSDTLFVGGCGRVDFPGSNPESMVTTLERLKQLPDDTIIYPGHDYGSTPTSTIGREKEHNQFLRMNRKEFMDSRVGK